MAATKLPAVPETILKKRKRQAESRALRAKEALKAKITKKVRNIFFIQLQLLEMKLSYNYVYPFDRIINLCSDQEG